jgi:hypothetical protein
MASVTQANTPGPQGPEGESAYQVWLGEGNIGTEQDFFDSLTAPPSFETVSKNLITYDAAFNYTLDELTSIVYTTGGGTITKTFNYTGDDLTSVVLSGDTPAGIDLTKTLSYTLGNLTDINYT